MNSKKSLKRSRNSPDVDEQVKEINEKIKLNFTYYLMKHWTIVAQIIGGMRFIKV
jgi:hypothetical protein